MLHPLRKPKQLHLERTYRAPIERVWDAWTDPELLRRWWGPEKTTVTACEIDLRVGGHLRVVTEAGPEMGKYAGTRWPMSGTFVLIDRPEHLVYDATSCTEGDEDGSTIRHTNDVRLRSVGSDTVVTLAVSITEIGPKAKMAAFGMKWGYKAQLDALEELLA
jgi:uncharacterized protein YndB with AHSA1/START domain